MWDPYLCKMKQREEDWASVSSENGAQWVNLSIVVKKKVFSRIQLKSE